jgi:hypothetical protein
MAVASNEHNGLGVGMEVAAGRGFVVANSHGFLHQKRLSVTKRLKFARYVSADER